MDLIGSLIPGYQPPVRQEYTTLVEGRVLTTPTAVTQGLYFTIRQFDDEAHRWGPAPWMPRVEPIVEPDGLLVCRILMPTVGARVLIGFVGDDGSSPWVVAWWPVTATYENTNV